MCAFKNSFTHVRSYPLPPTFEDQGSHSAPITFPSLRGTREELAPGTPLWQLGVHLVPGTLFTTQARECSYLFTVL